MTYNVIVRESGKVLASFSSHSEAEWFAYHNVYVPEQLEIVRG